MVAACTIRAEIGDHNIEAAASGFGPNYRRARLRQFRKSTLGHPTSDSFTIIRQRKCGYFSETEDVFETILLHNVANSISLLAILDMDGHQISAFLDPIFIGLRLIFRNSEAHKRRLRRRLRSLLLRRH